MKFKHTFNVFVDNFSITYKQLLYRVIILTVASVIGIFGLYPFVHGIINSEQFNSLTDGLRGFIVNFLKGQTAGLSEISQTVKSSFESVIILIRSRMTQIVLCGLLILVLYIVQKWFSGLGNYTTAVLLNDKMALRANSPFVGTLIKNLKEAALYNLIYIPLSILYDLLITAGLFAALYYMFINIEFLFVSIFLFTLMFILALALKMTFTCDWLPALVRGKLGQKGAILYSFSRKNKNTLNVYSNFVVIILAVMALNVAVLFFTFGVGLLLTVPASYIIILSFELVNYYDRENIRYFVDKNTIVKPDQEHIMTREEFFTGSDDNAD